MKDWVIHQLSWRSAQGQNLNSFLRLWYCLPLNSNLIFQPKIKLQMGNQFQRWIMPTAKRLFKQKWKFVILSLVMMTWCSVCQWDSCSCHKLENEMFIPLDKHCSIFQIESKAKSLKQENWNFETSKLFFSQMNLCFLFENETCEI